MKHRVFTDRRFMSMMIQSGLTKAREDKGPSDDDEGLYCVSVHQSSQATYGQTQLEIQTLKEILLLKGHSCDLALH